MRNLTNWRICFLPDSARTWTVIQFPSASTLFQGAVDCGLADSRNTAMLFGINDGNVN